MVHVCPFIISVSIDKKEQFLTEFINIDSNTCLAITINTLLRFARSWSVYHGTVKRCCCCLPCLFVRYYAFQGEHPCLRVDKTKCIGGAIKATL